MVLRFEHRFCRIAALAGKPAATAAVFGVSTEGGCVMFLLRVYGFGRIVRLLLRNRPERCGHSAEMGREVRFRLSAVGRHGFSDAVFFRRPLRPSERFGYPSKCFSPIGAWRHGVISAVWVGIWFQTASEAV